MIEPQPLPENAREVLQKQSFVVTCPQGHKFTTGNSMWDIQVLREQNTFGGNFLNLTCPKCQTNFDVTI